MKLKHFLILFLSVILLTIPTRNASAENLLDLNRANELFAQAHEAYDRGDFEEAKNVYERLGSAGWNSPRVWINAGAASYRAGDIGRAVLYYQRALKLEPNNAVARQSLSAISPASNRMEESSFLGEVMATVFQRTSPVLWVLMGQLLWLLLCFGIYRLFRSSNRDERGHWWAVSGWSAVLLLICVLSGYANYRVQIDSNEAVVVATRAITYSEPSRESAQVLEIPAGTVVRLVDTERRGFVRVRLADGTDGFVNTADLERI